MNVDSFLKIGHSHSVCQDYILSGTAPVPYVILADGCSQTPNSEVGAMALCHCAYVSMQHFVEDIPVVFDTAERLRAYFTDCCEGFGNTVIRSVAALHTHMHPAFVNSLDATLIVAFLYNGVYCAYMYGDGFVCALPKDENAPFNVATVSYTPNAPAYLSYRMSRAEEYIGHNVQRTVLVDDAVVQTSVQNALRGYTYTCLSDDTRALLVASDGVDSFMFKEDVLFKTAYLLSQKALKQGTKYHISNSYPAISKVPVRDVLLEFTNFKLLKGPFLRRRVKKAMRELGKQGFINDDDLSIGCIHEE